MATPRSNSTCTLGSQEMGKSTLPSFSSCWPIAPLASAAVIRPAANKVRPDFVFIVSALSGLWARCSARLLHRPRRAPSIPLAPDFDCCPGVLRRAYDADKRIGPRRAICLMFASRRGSATLSATYKNIKGGRLTTHCALSRSETLVKLKHCGRSKGSGDLALFGQRHSRIRTLLERLCSSV